MEHYKAHPEAVFEGYYSKFDLPSGSHVVLIICSVPKAEKLPPFMVSFTYYPRFGDAIFQREHWVTEIQRINTGPANAFELRVPGMGFMRCEQDSKTLYEFTADEWSFNTTTTSHEPWSRTKTTPEGWMVTLPLPLHWHVHSLGSSCHFKLSIPSLNLPIADQKGIALVHQEKNWASSFPAAHMWIQARDGERGICVAGGKILGITAYILGYRSPDINLDFVPPYAMILFSMSPFMSVNVDWENRAFYLSTQSLWKKIVVRAKAPKEKGWFGLGSPFPEGHRPNFCIESFLAIVEVEIWERSWWGTWKQLQKASFKNASLEFAGEYFPGRSKKVD
ncbi:hypothetical protein CC78DRAFT_580253 [Lojkania enalia]|uniref:Uncharacterized protein n=1 Tax=Lojkania enalia TaxID=147567 RepID=A0A9P4K8C1_9PLEO|nr:hypothetical protein CC78DRAFT_580253 [Didymosphaeria enalia]